MMDEPTASVDMQTDRFVQTTVREAFKTRTVLTIAHRLDTVRDSDRLAVMDAGRLIELRPPDALLGNPASALARLVAAAGEGSVSGLAVNGMEAAAGKGSASDLAVNDAEAAAGK
eukprot:gnl/TRDRNA2_/TRDRNA2_31755_c0_seq1.p3 gnl/TRDRNA2_/TRDRNA2_31755_c0~~gnl/TRDRNA2_/TRDRNA2_31755_c0_seq1.p3  ORF type:complete len:115 (-),score=28.10 gnl/TRDRNA2_/TRDRNA2_31755_c0_seq1:186-530(-)